MRLIRRRKFYRRGRRYGRRRFFKKRRSFKRRSFKRRHFKRRKYRHRKKFGMKIHRYGGHRFTRTSNPQGHSQKIKIVRVKVFSRRKALPFNEIGRASCRERV